MEFKNQISVSYECNKRLSTMPPKKKQLVDQKIPKIGNDYPDFFRHASSFEEKQRLFQAVVDEENRYKHLHIDLVHNNHLDRYREVFAQDRDSKAISDPHLMLVKPH